MEMGDAKQRACGQVPEKLLESHDAIRGDAMATANIVEECVDRLVGDRGKAPTTEAKAEQEEASGLLGIMEARLEAIKQSLSRIQADIARL